MNDPIADMLTRIRNAAAVAKNEVSLPHSKLNQAVAELLKKRGFIQAVKVEAAPVGQTLILTLAAAGEASPITEIERISKPGRRYYVGRNQIPVVKRGRGVVIVSTSKGLMTGEQAKAAGVGGELICKVY